jgi:hypothetical protein
MTSPLKIHLFNRWGACCGRMFRPEKERNGPQSLDDVPKEQWKDICLTCLQRAHSAECWTLYRQLRKKDLPVENESTGR